MASGADGLLLYRIAHGGALPLLLPVLALHPRLRGGLGQRFGHLPERLPARAIWLHGASAGDVLALQPLAERLHGLGHPIVLSAWTRAGERMASRTGLPFIRAPLDLGRPVRRVLDRLRPRLLVLECLEIWPRLLVECAHRGIPVAVVNGRLSERSLRRYLRAPSLFRPCFGSLAYVSALTEDDALRFARAGTPEGHIEVRSSSKHAGLTAGAMPPLSPPRLVLGSIHAGEEAVLVDWLARLHRERRLSAVVAPRYPGRARAVRRRLQRLGVPAHLSSRGSLPGSVEVLDGIGALRDSYRGASLAFVGGSLVRRGGHNLVEPAACGVPVLFGPSVEHCSAEAAALQRAGAGWQVHDEDELRDRALALLDDPGSWRRASSAAVSVAASLAASADPLAARLFALAETSP